MITENTEKYMREALKEAKKAAKIDEVPVGCVIVRNDQIIARGHNLKQKRMQATAHAEMIALQKAAKKKNDWSLEDCDLYVTLEPCMMCAGAILHHRIRHLYYGTADPKGGMVDTLIQMKEIPHIRNYPKYVTAGVLQQECSDILKEFFREKRENKRKNKQNTER